MDNNDALPGRSRATAEVGTRSRTRSRLIRLSRSNGQVRCSPPPMVDALRRVRRRRSGTRLWTCCAGRAGTRIRSEAPHRILTIGRPAADRAGARPYHPIGIVIICETVHQGLSAEARSIRPRNGSNPRLPGPTNIYFRQQ